MHSLISKRCLSVTELASYRMNNYWIDNFLFLFYKRDFYPVTFDVQIVSLIKACRPKEVITPLRN